MSPKLNSMSPNDDENEDVVNMSAGLSQTSVFNAIKTLRRSIL